MIIYKTINLINGKIYIGQDSKNDDKYIGSGYLLSEAIKKYGKDNFKKEILDICEDKKDLDNKEIYWIKYYKSTDKKIGYNISNGGTGGKLVEVEWKKGRSYEEAYGEDKAKEIKEKFSIERKGKKRGWKNTTPEETGKKISEVLKSKDIKRSEENKEKISIKLKEYFKSEKGIIAKNKLSEYHKNKKLSNETKKKLSISMKGKSPKKLDVHSTSKIWFFYDDENRLILETIGNLNNTLKNLKINWRNIKKFSNLNECLEYKLENKIKYKIYYKLFYEKEKL